MGPDLIVQIEADLLLKIAQGHITEVRNDLFCEYLDEENREKLKQAYNLLVEVRLDSTKVDK